MRKKRKEKKKTKEGGLSPQDGEVRQKRKEKKKTKDGGLSPQEGDVRKTRKEKKTKRPRQARRWLPRRQGSVCPTPRILFLVHEYLGLEAARLG
jgi:hypothetical protein